MGKENKPWIDVYPLSEKIGGVVNIGKRVELNKELSDYCDKLWKPKAEKGWKSSWIAFAKNLKTFWDGDKKCYSLESGAMPFYQVDGIVKSIEERKSFAPKRGYSNCLSVGFLTATKDAKVIFQRRAQDVHCPNILIHEPCGYMASMNFASRAECDLEKYVNDSRLFDINTQLDSKKEEIANTFGVPSELVSYNPRQDFLACGWLTKEMYFSTNGKIDAKSTELKVPENQEVFFVPFENLKDLIYNQGKLSKIDANGYRPSNAKDIPLIDESLIGLVYGYKNLTGDKLDIPETIDRLNRDGLEIKVYDTSAGKSHEFPSKF